MTVETRFDSSTVVTVCTLDARVLFLSTIRDWRVHLVRLCIILSLTGRIEVFLAAAVVLFDHLS